MAVVSSSSLSLLLLLATLTSQQSPVVNTGRGVCDNGEFDIEKDLGGEENWACSSGEVFSSSGYYIPAGTGLCDSNTKQDPQPVCMSAELSYDAQPPSQGAYRMMAPSYGEYQYLPPQRWLHTLHRGGVAFLYHPCTNTEQVEQLKTIARNCLNEYVVTPYLHLTKEQPLAVVTWGCVFKMSWVHPPEVKEWLSKQNIHPGVDTEQTTEYYHKDLQKPAKYQQLATLCPNIPSTTKGTQTSPAGSVSQGGPSPVSSTPAGPCPEDTGQTQPCGKHTLRTLKQHQTGLTVLIALLGVVLLGFVLLLVYKLASSWVRRRPKNQRYKTVSKYFPFSYEKQSAEVVIPEVGMPKSGAAERQVLLDASDEDEL